MINILHISKFITPPYGGIENHVELLCSNMKKYNPILLSSYKSKIVTQKNFETCLAKSFGRFLSVEISPNIYFKGLDLINNNKIHLVHGQLPNPWANLVINSNKKTPNVITWQSDIIRQKYSKYLYNILQKKTLSKVDKIILPTKSHYSSSKFLQNLNIENKIEYIPIGIDIKNLKKLESVDPQFKKKIEQKISDRQVILTVGRHVYYKGYEYLLDAMRYVKKNSILIMVGEGPLTKKYYDYISKYKLNNVLIINRAKIAELKYLYSICSIFTLPSVEQTEAFGIVSAEAMVFKKPTIVCNLRNGVNELNQHEFNSIFVKRRSVDDLAEKINYLLDNENYAKKLGLNGYNHVIKNYDLDKVIFKIEKIYESLI